jgi:hypothetical protein
MAAVRSLAVVGVRRNRPGRSRAAFAAPLALCLLAAGCSGLLPATGSAADGAGSCVHLAVPAYFSPDPTHGWQRVIAAAPEARWVIMNPDNGPGSSRQAPYARAVALARQAGQQVLGYVQTRYGTRPAASVLADIATYRSWYGVTSVFLDEAPPGGSFLAEYQDYVSAVHAGGGKAVLNAGTVPDLRYFTFADAVVTFESAAPHDLTGSPPSSAPNAVPADKIWNIFTGVPGSALGPVLRLAREQRASVVYVTDDGSADPYDRLPSYWAQERRAVTAGC